LLESQLEKRLDSVILNNQLLEYKFLPKKPIVNFTCQLQSKLSTLSTGKVAAEKTVARLKVELKATCKSMTTIRNEFQVEAKTKDKQRWLISNLSE